MATAGAACAVDDVVCPGAPLNTKTDDDEQAGLVAAADLGLTTVATAVGALTVVAGFEVVVGFRAAIRLLGTIALERLIGIVAAGSLLAGISSGELSWQDSNVESGDGSRR